MSAWAVVLAVGAISFALRALPLLASDTVRPGPRAQRGMRHAGIGAMTALLVTSLASHRSAPGTTDVAPLVALAVAGLLAWRG